MRSTRAYMDRTFANLGWAVPSSRRSFRPAGRVTGEATVSGLLHAINTKNPQAFPERGDLSSSPGRSAARASHPDHGTGIEGEAPYLLAALVAAWWTVSYVCARQDHPGAAARRRMSSWPRGSWRARATSGAPAGQHQAGNSSPFSGRAAAIPLGIAIGMVEPVEDQVDPIIEILRPCRRSPGSALDPVVRHR